MREAITDLSALVLEATRQRERAEELAKTIEQELGELADSAQVGSVAREIAKEAARDFRNQLVTEASDAYDIAKGEAVAAFLERVAALSILRRSDS